MKTAEKCKAAGLKSLAEYIAENYDGNNAKFGRAFNPVVERALVGYWVAQGYQVQDGKMIKITVMRDMPELKK